MGAPSACIHKYVERLKNEFDFHIITKTDESNFPEWKEFDVRFISSSLHKLYKWCNKNIRNKKRVTFSNFLLMLINIIKLIQTQFLLPNHQHWEVAGYFNELEKLHKKKPLSTVIAVSNNFVTQLAMLRFKRKYPEVKWIAFITDPYAEFYIYYKYKIFKRLWRRLNLKKEQEIYNCCDYALFTAEMYKYVPNAFNINPSKVKKIEFALNKFTIESEINIKNYKAKECRLIYAGAFYREIRNPGFALSILKQIPEIAVDLYVFKGECEDIIEANLSSNIHRYEFMEREKYLRMLETDYDILINIGNNASLQAPSKMLELLSTGKPIINFYHAKDSQYEMIEKYPLGINIGKDDSMAVSKLKEFCSRMKGKRIAFEEVQNLFPDNNLEKQVDLLRSLIEL